MNDPAPPRPRASALNPSSAPSERTSAPHENEVATHIVTAAIEVHRTLGGPGLLESVYDEALAWELEQRGLESARSHFPSSTRATTSSAASAPT